MYESPGKMLMPAYSAVEKADRPRVPIQSVTNGNSDRQNRKIRFAHRMPWLTVSASSIR